MSDDRRNEGEGNRTADRDYREKATDFTKSHDTEKLAKKAKKQLDGKDGDKLREAEAKGKSKGQGTRMTQGSGDSWEKLWRRLRTRRISMRIRRLIGSPLIRQS